MSRKLLAGAVVTAFGLALHLIEPVSTVECARNAPGPAACTLRRTFFHAIPYERTDLASVAALVAEPERMSKADPQAVTCTALSLMNGEGDATPFACLKDADAVARAQRFFADASGERELRLGYSEPLVLGVSGGVTLAGLLTLGWAAAGRRAAETRPRRRPSGTARS